MAGFVINTLVNNGIIDKAKTATQEYKNAQDYEETQIAKYTNDIESYVDGNRGTVTLTEEEYTMFRSQFSNNENITKVSINKPNTWAAGIEYNFGDGVYGQRFTGTITTTASNARIITNLLIDTTATNLMVLSSGGIYFRGADGVYSVINQNDYSNFPSDCQSQIYVAGKRINFMTKTNLVRTAAPYDVWILYTK